MTNVKFLPAIVLFLSVHVFAQDHHDTVRVITGRTYLFFNTNSFEYTGTVINQNGNDLYIRAKKMGTILAHLSEIKKAEEVSPNLSHGIPKKSELSIGYALASSYKVKNVTMPHHQSVLLLNYRYALGRSLALGAGLGIDIQSGNSVRSGYGFREVFKSNVENISFAPELTLYYYNKDQGENLLYVKLYGEGAVGFVYTRDEKDSIFSYFARGAIRDNFGLSYHVSPFGIRIGRSLAAYVELGYGYKGILNFGVDFRFHRRRSRLKY